MCEIEQKENVGVYSKIYKISFTFHFNSFLPLNALKCIKTESQYLSEKL